MAEPIGSLVVRIGGDASDLLDAFKKGGKAAGDFSSIIESATGTVKALAVALEIREIAHFIASIAEAEDHVGKWAEKIGMSVEALSELKYGAGLANVSLDELGNGMKHLAKYMEDNHVAGVTLEDMLFRIADQFHNAEDGQKKLDAAVRIFGKSGQELIPLLNQGSAGLRANAEEARKLGLVISTETAKQAAEFNDNLKKVTEVTSALARELAGPLIKALSDSASEFIKARAEGEGFFAAMYAGMQQLLTGSDVDKWNKDFTDAVTHLTQVQDKLDEVKSMARQTKSPFDVDQVRMWSAELVKAQAEVSRLQSIKPLMAPDKATEKGGKKTGDLDFGGDAKGAQAMSEAIVAGQEQAAKDSQEAWGFYFAYLRKVGTDTTNEITGQLREGVAVTKEVTRQSADFLKEKNDERNAAAMAQFDAEEAAAIAQADVMQSIDGQSHSLRLESFLQANDAEYQEKRRYDQAIEDLERNYSDAELEALGGMHGVKEKMEQDHQLRMLAIRTGALRTANDFTRAGYVQQAQTIFGELASITAGVSQHNRQMFELNKVAGIANAIINAYIGISKTMSTYPYPINIAMAAAHAAAAFAQVDAIRSSSFQGGGGAPSIAGSTAAPAVTPVTSGDVGGGSASSAPDTVVHIHGDNFSQKTVRGLLEALSDAMRNGGRLTIAGA